MTSKQARKLKVGDKISTDSLPHGEHHEGIVIELGYNSVKTKWDDGQIGITHFDDMELMDKPD